MTLEYDANVLPVQRKYGPQKTSKKFGGVYGTKDGYLQAEWVFDATDSPAAAVTNLEQKLPANAVIMTLHVEVVEAVTFSSGADRTGMTVQNVIGDIDTTAEAVGITAGTFFKSAVSSGTVGTSAAELVSTLAATGGSTGTIAGGKLRVLVEFLNRS